MTQAQTQPRKVLLVLGMHRSGTSAVTRVVNLLGAELGRNLVEAGSDNPEGFWEHAEAVSINEDLLHGLGRTWYDMREMPRGWEQHDAAKLALERIKALIGHDFEGKSFVAMKDPRMSLTAPLWIEAFQSFGFEVVCLFVVRNPKEVVRSLQARNKWAREPLFLMWVQYIMEAAAATRHLPRTLVTYDQLLSDWKETTRRIGSDLQLEWPNDPRGAAAQIDAFLDKGQRHHVATNQVTQQESGESMPLFAAQVYSICLDIAAGEEAWDALNQLRLRFSEIADLYAAVVDNLQTLRWDAEGRAQSAEARVAQLNVNAVDLVVDKVDMVAEVMSLRIDDLQSQLNAVHERLRDRLDRKEDLETLTHLTARDGTSRAGTNESSAPTGANAGLSDPQSRAGRENAAMLAVAMLMEKQLNLNVNVANIVEKQTLEISDLRVAFEHQLQNHASELVYTTHKLDDMGSRLGDADHKLDDIGKRLDDADGKFSSSMSTLARQLDEQHAEHATHADRMTQQLLQVQGVLDQHVSALQGAMGQRENEINAFMDQLSRKDAEVKAMKSSASWRVTAPLRWLRRAFSPRGWRSRVGRGMRMVYDRLPLSTTRRLAVKRVLFRTSAPLIRNTATYQAWRKHEKNLGEAPGVMQSDGQAPLQSAAPVIVEPTAEASRVLGDLYQLSAGGVHADYVPMDDRPADTANLDVRAIAFYLPQFHPIPENDAWWGRGFTEWTNVSKAVPQFVGHHQPHLPGELGFYDLRIVDVMRRQVELARHYGVQGFCFHYYWFGGRLLLERPLQQFLDNKDIDFPFCICWANENWTRRWDGLDQEMLIAQNYSPEDDIAFITALEPMLRDPRYIRVGGRPLVVLYRPSILPDAAATVLRWRDHCRNVGIGELFVAMVQFDVEDPRRFGFDAAIEFPPHKLARDLAPINGSLQIVNPGYSGHVVDYRDIIESARKMSDVDYHMFRGVFPSWDNEARKPGRGYTFANATPRRYREWLNMAVDYARRHPVHDERIVFINAWNEWAEGAHLEPDRRYGYAYLKQTRAALRHGADVGCERNQVVVVSHDAHPHGAQYLALNLVRELRRCMGMDIEVLLLGEGRLVPDFEALAPVHKLYEEACDVGEVARDLYRRGFSTVIANTAVSGKIVGELHEAGLKVTSLVHELPGVIRNYGLQDAVREMSAYAEHIVVPAAAVGKGLCEFVDTPQMHGKLVTRPQGMFTRSRYRGWVDLSEARGNLRRRLSLSKKAKIVLSVGYADWRKGVDLLAQAAISCMNAEPDLHFVWVGHHDSNIVAEATAMLSAAGCESRFHFVGLDFDTDDYYAGADVYALTSREDPFPSVVLESLSVGTPVVAFAATGGAADLIEQQGGGICVPAFDTAAYAQALLDILRNSALRSELGATGVKLVDSSFSFRTYAMDLLALSGMDVPRVSVVVPNYNYARYMQERLATISDQTVPVYEIIVLDDASSDDSLSTLQDLRCKIHPEPRIITNQTNSGSVFRQWLKGVELAKGDYVWIAEADDLCKPNFLRRLTRLLQSHSEAVLGYTQSEQIDESGKVLSPDYLGYTDDLDLARWSESYLADGVDEVTAGLAVKNTLPNVSAVLFRREALLEVLQDNIEDIASYRIAGDWLVYLLMLKKGKMVYDASPCNQHRRHSTSVTLGSAAELHYQEVVRVQRAAEKLFELDERTKESARLYARMVRSHLGLPDAHIAATDT
ncbi:glycoside hydrolase family 99-like domain-containing protein [Dyella psychrodurans]|uniref:Glycosyltransferase n=1 Tax=Dyella psychrodurans TaxID=1927960 RepID=A0A370X546_9GAMM|nr:glycoside hydrolase family 99-like domain-containing protein [Dyella psychrodurans]RDS83407.1 glycosyltransferase [Dyella psychrodurans]